MDKYGIYVWTAYGITFFVFAVNIGLVLIDKIRTKKIIQNESQT